MKSKASIVYDEGIALYDFGSDQEMRGDRFPRYLKLLESRGILDLERVSLVKPKSATIDDLLLVHSVEYIDRVDKTAQEKGFLDEDTPLRTSTVHAAKLIVGAALKAAELVANREVDIAQAVGGGLHHAGRDYGGGWCIYNDVAAAAKSSITRHGFNRILIFDTDAHAGNGTMDIFYEEPKVLYLGVHQDPDSLFPYTGYVDQFGKGVGLGYTVNVPLPVGADDDCMQSVIDRVFKPVARQFNPNIIIRNGGADPHYMDELADLGLSYNGLRMIGEATVDVASEIGCGVVDLVCSGYNPGYEEYGLYALLCGLLGLEMDLEEEITPKPVNDVLELTNSTIDDLGKILSDYWNIE